MPRPACRPAPKVAPHIHPPCVTRRRVRSVPFSAGRFLFLAANNEGQTLLWPSADDNASDAQLQTVDLTGPDLDAIYGAVSDGHHAVYTACADGRVRKYDTDFAW